MSSRDEMEVLEIGADGAFDIPSPEKIKKATVLDTCPSSATQQEGEAFIATRKFEGKMAGYCFKTGPKGTGYYFDPIQGGSMKRKSPAVDYTALQKSIKPGEYKVYQDSKAMLVLLRTSSVDEKVKDIKLNETNNVFSNVVVSVEAAESYSVEIPNNVGVSSQGTSAKIWEDFVSIRIPVI